MTIVLDSRQLTFELRPSTAPFELPDLTPAKIRTRLCIKCNQEKVFSQFTWAKHQQFGYRVYGSVCLACKSVWRKGYLKGIGKERDIKSRKNRYEKNPYRNIIEGLNKRAAKYGAKGRITIEDWHTVVGLYGARCVYCGLGNMRLQLDHIWPLSLANKGLEISQFATNELDNLVPCCGFCNRAKFSRPLIVFIGWKYDRLQ